VLSAIAAMGPRFIFAHGYENLAEIEATALRDRARTVTVPLPNDFFERKDSWTGSGDNAILLCPAIREQGYYRELYDAIKQDFGDLPHAIFGRQVTAIDDPTVLEYLSDDALLDLYATAPVLIYPSREPRHVHYSPVEAMVIGTPVLYRRDALIDIMTHQAGLPGACADTSEMHAKAQALIRGDRDLAQAIRASQDTIVEQFSMELAGRQWADVLTPGGITS
jgi:hypothetical protein